MAWISPVIWPFLRILAVFSSAPIFSARSVPMRSRVSLAMLVAWSESLPSMPFFVGPLCMFKGERLTAAQAAYARGEMGQLTPSDVRWVR